MATVTYDLPAFNIIPPFEAPNGPNAGNLAVAGDGLEVVFNSDSQPIAIGNWGNGPGAPSVYTGSPPDFFPTTTPPVGAVLSSIAYVINAYVESPGAHSTSLTGHGFFYPVDPVTAAPFLFMDHNTTSRGLVFSGLPDLAYGADVLAGPDPEPSVTVGINKPRVRVWYVNDVGNTTPIHIDYMALRVTYTIPDTIQPPLRQIPRTDGLAASSATRHYPPSRSVQASNRRAGGYI